MAAAFSSALGLRVVLEQGGEALDDAAGRHHPHRLAGQLAHLLGHRVDVVVVGQQHHLGRSRAPRPTSRIWAVEGFIDWPPGTMWCTPRDRKIRPMPSPVATATTAVRGGGPGGLGRPGAGAPSRTQRSSSTCSARSVTRMSRGRPASRAASIGRADVVGVDVAVPQPVAPDHHDGVADAGPHLLEGRRWCRRAPRAGT